MKQLPISSQYQAPIRDTVVSQLLLAVLMLMLLDGGMTAKVGGYAMIGFWAGVAVVMFRRPRDPRRSDLIYVRWGYPVMLVLAICIALIVTTVRGTAW